MPLLPPRTPLVSASGTKPESDGLALWASGAGDAEQRGEWTQISVGCDDFFFAAFFAAFFAGAAAVAPPQRAR